MSDDARASTPATVVAGRALFALQTLASGPIVAVMWFGSTLAPLNGTMLPSARLFSWWAEVLVVLVPLCVFICSLGASSLWAALVTWLEVLWLTTSAVVCVPAMVNGLIGGVLATAIWSGLALVVVCLVLPALALGFFVVPDASRRFFAGAG